MVKMTPSKGILCATAAAFFTSCEPLAFLIQAESDVAVGERAQAGDPGHWSKALANGIAYGLEVPQVAPQIGRLR